jgi:nucleoside-diphosphate-sugar epimerase
VYVPAFFDEIKKLGAAFYVGEGKTTRSWVHIEDLMTVYLKLVEAAIVGGSGADWGREVRPSLHKTYGFELARY